MTTNALAGPEAISTGATGRLRIGGLAAGAFTEWRIVISPTTRMPTLIGRGRFLRYFRQAVGTEATADVTPKAPPAYIGRPKAPAPRPFRLIGTLVELTSTSITIASGTIVRG